jgi:hypothetical protein
LLCGAAMKRTAIALTLIAALLFSAVVGTLFLNLAMADPIVPQQLPETTIKADGSIVPETELINRTGNIYILTADLYEQPILIQRNNIIFDGAGHKVNSSKSGYRDFGIKLDSVFNVTIKDVEVCSSDYRCLYLYGCSNCMIQRVKTVKDVYLAYSNFNTITESNISISLAKSNNNTVVRNNLNELHISGYEGSEYSDNSNVFYGNNIFSNISSIAKQGVSSYVVNSANFWDNGSIGNCWSDYLEKYADVSEIGDSGIGDVPYIIDAHNVDNCPLMYPYDIEKNTVMFPSQRSQSEPFPTTLVAAASGASAAIVGLGVLLYFKKRKR